MSAHIVEFFFHTVAVIVNFNWSTFTHSDVWTCCVQWYREGNTDHEGSGSRGPSGACHDWAL